MSKGILLRKLVCVLLCSGLASKGLIAQKNYGNPVAEAEVRSYFTAHATQFGVKSTELSSLKITSDNTDKSSQIRHIYIQQQYNGLDVVNGVAALHIKEGARLTHANYQFAKLEGAKGGFSAYTPATAVQKAMTEVGITMPVGGLQIKEATSGTEEKTVFKAANTTWDIPVRKAYLLDESSKLVTGVWEVQLYRRDLQNYWIMYLDGTTGKVISKTDMVLKCNFGHQHLETDEIPNDLPGPFGKTPSITLIANCTEQPEGVYNAGIKPNTTLHLQEEMPVNGVAAGITNTYRVLDKPFEAPNQAGALNASGQFGTVATGGNATASPDGWHKVGGAAAALPSTQGNNVHAFYDPSPGPLGGVPTTATSAAPTATTLGQEPFTFDYPLNLAAEPDQYRNAAIVNLFYWNNLMHDVFYQFGFTEANRNFEASHTFSTGTKGSATGQGDYVLAQAQDGGGTNNANFLTLADGVPASGQMQMYLWTGSEPENIVRITSSTATSPASGASYFAIQGSFGSTVTGSTNLNTNPVVDKPFIIVQKNALSTVGTSSQGCGTGQQGLNLPPANDVNGKIVLIDRGGCSFVEKMFGAQLGGAAGVIVINNIPGDPPIAMGGTDGTNNAINIPGVMVSFENGQILKNVLANGGSIAGTLKKDISAAKRDGDLDNGVIAHEYGHGISTRLVGGGPNPTGRLTGNEQGGEGWSDLFALYMTTKTADLLPATTAHVKGVLPNRGIGTYVTYQSRATGGGIRPTPYSIDMAVNPSTYSFIKNPIYTVPHGIGYIWCSMLYEVEQEFVDKYGFNDDVYNNAQPTSDKNVPAGAGGNNVFMRLIIEGLILTPAGPTFVQERDAILKADTMLYGGQHGCIIWKAFAKRGLGFSAVAGTNALGDEVEQFNTHPICNPQAILQITKTADALAVNGNEINYTITAKNITPAIAGVADIAATNFKVTDVLPPFTNYISATGGGTNSNNTVTWNVPSLARDASVSYTVRVAVNHPNPARLIFREEQEGTAATNNFQSTAADGSVRTFALTTDATRNVGTNQVWFVQDYDAPGSNAILRLKNPVTVASGTQLIFNHKYASEVSYDGGVVEISTDNTNWAALPVASFTKNGYSGAISTTNNPFIGAATLNAFTGSSPGYIQSIATLGTYTAPIYIRFRFTSDAGGGSVSPGGWWIDEVYLASPATFVNNTVTSMADNAASAVSATASTLVYDPTILPIAGVQELKATVRNKSIVLGWETTYEKDNRGFEIQRKAPNETDYKTVDFVNGAGTSSRTIPYSYTDASAAKGVLYQYRLKQVSYSNSVQFSNTATARIVDQAFAFSFSPNPAQSLVTFNINNDSRSAVTIEIADLTGKKVKTINAGNEGYISTKLNLDNFVKGVYLVTIRSGNTTETQKLVVQ